MRSELETLRGLAWSAREYFTVKSHKDASILVETMAEIERDILGHLARLEVCWPNRWHSPDEEQGGGE